MKQTTIVIDNFKPVSVNHSYSQNHGRRYLDPRAQEAKEVMSWAAKAACKHSPIDTAVEVIITLVFPNKQRRDLDNYVKLILDSLTGICFIDDSQITDLTVMKRFQKNPAVMIEVNELG